MVLTLFNFIITVNQCGANTYTDNATENHVNNVMSH